MPICLPETAVPLLTDYSRLVRLFCLTHRVRIYKEYRNVCPLVGIGALPTPLSPASVPLPPEPKGGGGGAHSPAGEALGES
jgi:hypothetical protein